MKSNELQISWLSRDVHKDTLESNHPKLKAKILFWKLPGFSGDSVVKKKKKKKTPVNAGDMGSILDPGNPTFHGATKPVPHNYWACALEPRTCNYSVQLPQLLKPTFSRACAWQQEKPAQREACTWQLESSPISL